MRRLSLKSQFTLVVAVAAVALVALAGATAFTKSAVMVKERHAMLRQMVESGHSILGGFQARVEAGELTEAQARAQGYAALLSVRFEPDGYFFGFDENSVTVFHVNEALVGRDLSQLEDENGQRFIAEIVRQGMAGGGVTTYPWPKRDSQEGETFPKSSYSMEFEPWGVVIGTGVYVDDIDAEFAATLGWLLAALAVTLGALSAFATLTIRNAQRTMNGQVGALQALTRDDDTTPVPDTDLPNDFGEIARATAALQETVAERRRLRAQQDAASAERQAERERADAARAADAAAQADAIAAVGATMGRLAQGDLGARCGPVDPRFEALRGDVNGALDRLCEMLDAMHRKGANIDGAKDEIAQSSATLSQRTEHQAATLEETAAAVDELTSSVRQTADGAKAAAEHARAVSAEATGNMAVATEAVAAMRAIEAGQAEMGQTIAMIEDVAFQTNLLALNASVEAARVGEQGKGFAVVAQEVRELAGRTAEAAQKINAMIASSTERVVDGVKLVDRTGESFAAIVKRIEETADVVTDIATRAAEQNAALQSINGSVVELDQSTQANAAMAEEVSAAAMALAGDISALRDLMGAFDTGHAAGGIAAAA